MKSITNIRTGVSFLVVVCLLQQSFGQDISALKSELKSLSPNALLKKGVSISGSISGNHVYYNAVGIDSRAVPFNVLYMGNVMVDIFGKIKMPVSFSLSNQNINFSHSFNPAYQFRQPINRLTFKPTYKGLTLHLGTGAMVFSPFTLAGHRFEGVGLEYKNPKKPFYVGFMVGNLQKAIRIDTSFQTRYNTPSYRRRGLGVQLGYRKQDDLIELIYFTAADQQQSLPYSLDDQNILPQKNAVVSIKGSKLIYKKILFNTEIAYSGITNDDRATESTLSNNVARTFGGTFTPKTSTDYRMAFKAEVLYRAKTMNIGVKYSRIDPNYRTLGAYFFNNDLETIETKIATQLLAGKLTMAANVGLQQDNVQKQKLKTNQRWVGAANLNYVPSTNTSVMLTYSNFSSFSNLRSSYDYLKRLTYYNALDTLNFRQINQNMMLVANMVLPNQNKDIKQQLSLNGVLQRGEDSQGSQSSNNNLTNVSLDYGFEHSAKKLTLNGSFNYSQSYLANQAMSQWGPSLSLMKAINQQWKLNLFGMYSWGRMSGVTDRSINAHGGVSGQVGKKTNLLLNVIYLNRKVTSTDRYIPSFREMTATIGFTHNFTLLKLAKK